MLLVQQSLQEADIVEDDEDYWLVALPGLARRQRLAYLQGEDSIAELLARAR